MPHIHGSKQEQDSIMRAYERMCRLIDEAIDFALEHHVDIEDIVATLEYRKLGLFGSAFTEFAIKYQKGGISL